MKEEIRPISLIKSICVNILCFGGSFCVLRGLVFLYSALGPNFNIWWWWDTLGPRDIAVWPGPGWDWTGLSGSGSDGGGLGSGGRGEWPGTGPSLLRHPHPGPFIICHHHRGSGDKRNGQGFFDDLINLAPLKYVFLPPSRSHAYDVRTWQVLRCHVEVRGRIRARTYWDNINRRVLRTTSCYHQTIKFHLPQVTRWQVVCQCVSLFSDGLLPVTTLSSWIRSLLASTLPRPDVTNYHHKVGKYQINRAINTHERSSDHKDCIDWLYWHP